MNFRSFAATAAVVLGASTCASAQFGPNLLNNAGFENPLGFDFSNPLNWNGFFGGPGGTFLQAFNDTGATPRSGSNALVTTIRGNLPTTNGAGAFTGHVQTVDGSITPGQEYEFSVWARTNPSVNTGAEFRIEWYDSSNTRLPGSNQAIAASLNSDYQLFSTTESAPAGAAIARVVLAVQSFDLFGPVADTSVAWDDATFRTAPAPASAALLGLGGLLASRRRR